MYAVIGITGKVGGSTARALLNEGDKVRGIVRNTAKAVAWRAAGVELTVADMTDAAALEAGLRGVEGAFVMIPPNFAPSAGFPEARAIVAALRKAISVARPPKVVYLSSVGAHRQSGLGLITQLHILEEELGSLPIPSAFIRAAWFMENYQWDVDSARERGEIDAFLSPVGLRDSDGSDRGHRAPSGKDASARVGRKPHPRIGGPGPLLSTRCGECILPSSESGGHRQTSPPQRVGSAV